MSSKKEINDYIKKLKSRKIRRRDIPSDLLYSDTFKDAERKAKLRIPDKRGYDVISNLFFVEELIRNGEELESAGTVYFETFEEYNNFLSGKLYENACYFQLNSKNYDIDIKHTKDHFIDETIDDYVFDKFTVDPQEYAKAEKAKKLLYKWTDKFFQCENAEQFFSVSEKYQKSKCSITSNAVIFALLYKRDKKKTFELFMDILNTEYNGGSYALILCEYFGAQTVSDNYNPTFEYYSKQMVYRRKKEVRDLLKNLLSNDYWTKQAKGFDSKSHLYFIKTEYFFGKERYSSHRIVRYFDTFDEFADHLKGNLSDCNLSGAIIDTDFSNYISNEATIFPVDSNSIQYEVQKFCSSNTFSVYQKWTDNNGNVIDKKTHRFKYFFDFAYFLHYDLSGADCSMCDGIDNLTDTSIFVLNQIKARSQILERFGIKYKKLPEIKTDSFSPVLKNEKETALILEQPRKSNLSFEESLEMNVVAYVSDLHLIHKLMDFKCRNDADVLYVLRSTVNNIKKVFSDITLIGGDVSSDFSLYQQFIGLLSDKNRRQIETERDQKIFILGNHELWGFPGENIDYIIEKYRSVIDKADMYLLHNSIIYKTTDRRLHEISQKELSEISVVALRKKLNIAQLIIFGGIGFSGCNEEFNANNGIYRKTVTREQEIQESIRFNELYEKVCAACIDKNVIIFTHMPKTDWSGNNDTVDNFVYVSGHTHRNYFYDDGITRIYADNQTGYNKRIPFLKKFYIDKQYDFFADYKDGIYEISKDDYNDFNRAKNLNVDYNRDDTVIMLKREGYYCFLRQGKTGLCLLNGGALKKLWHDDITYYYDNMVKEIAFIKKPLDKYASLQQKIADQVKLIGGYGRIHGCIIDIDFYNHIYVNPFDLTITGYFAFDMISKYVYKNVPSLLKKECPNLYEKFNKLLENKSENALVIADNTELDLKPEYYPDTDIYRASREIRKMQKVNKGILTTWIDPDTGKDLLE